MSESSMALIPPTDAWIKIDEVLMERVIAESRTSQRRRMILPLHKTPTAKLQRMLNAIQPDSYIRPHRHAADRAESLVVLRGKLRYLTFNSVGSIHHTDDLNPGEGVDIEGGIWHAFQALEVDTVLFEVKPGPYNPETDKEFAVWAPSEFSTAVSEYMRCNFQNRSG